jgi:hypothetical protein
MTIQRYSIYGSDSISSYDKGEWVRFKDHQQALSALEARIAELEGILAGIAERVTNGPLCYYGNSTGYQPQIGSAEVDRWRATLSTREPAPDPYTNTEGYIGPQ